MGAVFQKSDSDDAGRFTEDLRVRCPPSLKTAIDKAATRDLMSVSEYVRRSVIARLKADCIDPVRLR